MWPSGKSDSDSDIKGFDFPFDTRTNQALRSWFDQTASQFQSLIDETSTDRWGTSLSDLASIFRSPDSMVAFRTPSVRQYDACKSQNGRSIWTEDGFWRCLLKDQSKPSHLKYEFNDLTGFLDYQRDLLQKRRAEEAERRKQIVEANPPQTDLTKWGNPFESGNPFPGNDRPRLISEEEAAGKKPVWQSQNSETVTLDDGSIQTRTQLVKYFEDGTAVLKRSNDSGSDSSSSKSWFWK